MPRTKRNKLTTLSKTTRKTRDDKGSLIENIRAASDEFAYIWLFSIGNMRNNYLKEVRQLWEGSRIFFGKNRVMAKALGQSVEEEVKTGVLGISQRLSGSVGLLFTDSPPAEVADWFDTHERKDYARTGNLAKTTVTLPAGPLLTIGDDEPETLPGALEPQLRKLGLHTELKRGVPTLRQETTVCKEGKKIDTKTAQILKHLHIQQASFRIVPLAYYDASKEAVTELDLTAEQEALVQQAAGKEDENLPGSKKTRTTTVRTRSEKKSKAAKTDGEEDEDDEMDEDDDEDIDEDGTGGDKVTNDMMLPIDLR